MNSFEQNNSDHLEVGYSTSMLIVDTLKTQKALETKMSYLLIKTKNHPVAKSTRKSTEETGKDLEQYYFFLAQALIIEVLLKQHKITHKDFMLNTKEKINQLNIDNSYVNQAWGQLLYELTNNSNK